PDRVKPERLDELAQLESVVHVCGVRHRGRAAVVLCQEAFPVALVVAGHHHAAVHVCSPLSLRYTIVPFLVKPLLAAIVYCLDTSPRSDPGGMDMPDGLDGGLQEDEKIAGVGIDAGAGKLEPRGETPAAGAPSVFAVSPDRHILYVGYRGTPGIESWRIDSAGGALTSLGRVATEHWPTYLATDRTGKYLLSAHYQGAYAAVYPLGGDGAVSGPAVDRQNPAPPREPHPPVEPLRLRPHHRPAERQRPGAAEEHPRPEFHRPVSVRRGHRETDSQRAVQARPARPGRASALLLPSHARSRLFLRRAGLQRDGLPRRSCLGHPRRRGNDPVATPGPHRAQYLFADLSDAIGPLPLCRQPRPQQHRRLRRRPGDRGPDARWACVDRGGAHRVRSRFAGDVPVRRGDGDRTPRLLPGRRGERQAGPAGYLLGRAAARGGSRDSSRPLTALAVSANCRVPVFLGQGTRDRPVEVRERGLMPTEREAALCAGGEAALNVLDDWDIARGAGP